ncbi:MULTISPECIES: phage tail protein [unclassified Pseudomonas]|uniref:phage tail protein n=1 Tax=unclassified Pseudomonas TaxID=196821 RepID=UPI0009159784|nr:MULTISPECIES: phage tail protein [unclassified Pseudomonas]SFX92646.1 P2 phage tail completion protein R (GpR) [Pseudomonas sp. NFACC43]SFY29491.1 P2 phage tail completion protein R (GpR) [Pseudomonas sp. NFACC47-1]
MTKLQSLTAYLLERRLVEPELLDGWTEQVTLNLVWKPDLDGMHLGDMRYRAAIVLESFADHPARLMALIGSWLETHDPDRDRHELPAPQFAVEPLDNDLFDVEISLEFVEPQYLAEDPAGEIQAFGKTWAFVPFDLWIAERGEVATDGRA